ncbi:hypothetical protein [Emticicia fluvialis]|uniref:hypothetical protein n=1 Tax=Emticicia fluvialis TaxID=2974474 RepID=UPI0021664BFD|nr:hypothetical protein [Emticicia fluvialis]
MKNLLLLLLAFAFFGCGKPTAEPEPQTDLAVQVVGKYRVYETVVDTKTEAVDPRQPEVIIEIISIGENKIVFKLTNLEGKMYTEPFYSRFLLRKKGTAIEFNLLDSGGDYGLFYNQVLQLYDGGVTGSSRMVRAKRI